MVLVPSRHAATRGHRSRAARRRDHGRDRRRRDPGLRSGSGPPQPDTVGSAEHGNAVPIALADGDRLAFAVALRLALRVAPGRPLADGDRLAVELAVGLAVEWAVSDAGRQSVTLRFGRVPVVLGALIGA